MSDKAFQKLSRMVAADSEPKLASSDIDLLLASFAVTDKNGVAPNETDWQPTYDFRRAAAEGWRWKAAKASELVSADLDGERMSSNQIFAHCQEMIRTYTRRGAASLYTGQ